jgi:leucyl-tRNA synthetase
MFEQSAADYWMPVDQYIGGIEHAVLHLLYARFYTKVLRDLGLTKIDEPFMALLSQGMVIKDGAKMSKSKGNVVSDDFVREKYGADTGRLFELFAAPPEKDLEWNDQGIEGASRFLNRVWRFVLAHFSELGGVETPPPSAPPDRSRAVTLSSPISDPGKAFRRVIHETIRRVTGDIEREHHFNTAIAAIMELFNALQAYEQASGAGGEANPERTALLREATETLLLLLGPFCPHVTEELWSRLGHSESLFRQRWPEADPAALQKTEVTVVVQVDGKVRGRLVVDVDAAEERVRQLALADDRVRPWLGQRRVEKVVVVPNRLVNIVTRA